MHKYEVCFYVDWQDEIKEIEDVLNAKVNRTFVSQLPDNQHKRKEN